MCMRIRPAPEEATSSPTRGSFCSEVTSLIRAAPRSSAASATSALDVSTEIGNGQLCRSASSTGTSRLSSSPESMPREPGRVDSAPMSRMSAPSATIFSARATAMEGSGNRLPA